MTKRSRRTGLGDAFDFRRIDPYGTHAGAAPTPDEQETPHSALRHIETLLPDPWQPRRLLPADLAEALASGTPPTAVLAAWRARAEAPDAVPFLADQFAEVRQLAESIAQQGLINPVTAREVADGPSGVRYRLVTGERRWWAHVLLAQEGRRIPDGAGWIDATQIRVSVVPPGTRVRSQQLAENWHRAEMSVLDRANGLWALRRELSDLPDSPGDATAEAEPLVPWSAVEGALGISRQHRHRILRVLDLSPPALALVEQHRLPERLLRPIATLLAREPGLQEQALRQIIAWQAEDEGRNLTASAAELARRLQRAGAGPGPAPAAATEAASVSLRQVRARVRGTLRLLQQIDAAGWEALTAAVERDPRLAAQLAELHHLIGAALPDALSADAEGRP